MALSPIVSIEDYNTSILDGGIKEYSVELDDSGQLRG